MRTNRSILIVEDEAELAMAIEFHLSREGYKVRRVGDGATAIAEASRNPPDLIILDRMLPGLAGDDVVIRLRGDARTASIPVIMLTAKAEETDEVVGFALGADDYVRKPAPMKVLVARVAAVLRRREAGAKAQDVLSSGPITLDRARHEVTVDSVPVQLTATEFRMLATLMAARGRVLDREQLIDNVLGSGVAVTQRTIDVHVAALRRKLGSAAGWIHTVRGVGYAYRVPAADGVES
ncbi:MAG: response regulator transcription factor [Planctomycetia bacterium]|nr:MAG: response regulator transcription factor [Planctomycetia bacterium]